MKPIKPKKEYDKLITNKIRQWQWDIVYKPILKILKDNVVLNDSKIIEHAIQSGTIYYQNGAFYSNTGRFTNNIALELEKIGAKYSKYGRCYRLAKDKIPVNLLWYIDEIKAKTFEKVVLINQLLEQIGTNIEEELKSFIANEAVETIFFDLQKRLVKQQKEYKISVIEPKLSDKMAKEIAQNYTDNLRFWIKEWEPEQITKMRETVVQMAVSGKSQKTIADYIQKEFNVTDRHKAEFLARNETSIAVTSYLKAKYKEDGYTHFKWFTNLDGRERPLHKQLNGVIFSFDEQPIIYEDKKKGLQQRGFPGETYNCRCGFIPVTVIDNKVIAQSEKPIFLKDLYAYLEQQKEPSIK